MKKLLMRKIKLVIGLFVAVVALHFVSTFYFSKDEQQMAAEAFFQTSPEIKENVGQITSIKMTRYISAAGTDTKGPYKIYHYVVQGEKSRARIIVRAVPQGEQGSDIYVIESLDLF